MIQTSHAHLKAVPWRLLAVLPYEPIVLPTVDGSAEMFFFRIQNDRLRLYNEFDGRQYSHYHQYNDTKYKINTDDASCRKTLHHTGNITTGFLFRSRIRFYLLMPHLEGHDIIIST